ncbi:MAG: AmmeMemoRadiSam system radical SAM enzyme [bacterium]|nr:AmmeMemoRadiSam system radical SAM enzyme [bacterium]
MPTIPATIVPHPTTHWSMLADGRLQCDVCPRECRLQEGQRGACFVRGREQDQIMLYSYGRSSGFCLDPIEKKPLNHFLPGSSVLSFGTAGCNLSCKFCQNWDISKSREMDTLMDAAGPEQLAQTAKGMGAASIAYTYNDPVVFMEYATDVAQAAHELGVKSVAVTAGFMKAAARTAFYRHMDAANIDLKGFTDRFYRQLCGASLGNVLETLEYVHNETKTWLEITTLLIPGENDSPQEIEAMTRWIADHLGPDVPLHFTAFHPDHKLDKHLPTPAATLSMARRIAQEQGLHHVYTGNVHDETGGSSFCTGCGTRVIGRDWYELRHWHLSAEGNCLSCNTPLPGLFNGAPGKWGHKRIPVRIT